MSSAIGPIPSLERIGNGGNVYRCCCAKLIGARSHRENEDSKETSQSKERNSAACSPSHNSHWHISKNLPILPWSVLLSVWGTAWFVFRRGWTSIPRPLVAGTTPFLLKSIGQCSPHTLVWTNTWMPDKPVRLAGLLPLKLHPTALFRQTNSQCMA